jgi:hypothetical protein
MCQTGTGVTGTERYAPGYLRLGRNRSIRIYETCEHTASKLARFHALCVQNRWCFAWAATIRDSGDSASWVRVTAGGLWRSLKILSNSQPWEELSEKWAAGSDFSCTCRPFISGRQRHDVHTHTSGAPRFRQRSEPKQHHCTRCLPCVRRGQPLCQVDCSPIEFASVGRSSQ